MVPHSLVFISLVSIVFIASLVSLVSRFVHSVLIFGVSFRLIVVVARDRTGIALYRVFVKSVRAWESYRTYHMVLAADSAQDAPVDNKSFL